MQIPTFSKLAALALAPALALGCGGNKPKPRPGLFDKGGTHALECTTLQGQRAKEVARKRYLPNELLLHRWPAASPQGAAKGPGAAKPSEPIVTTEADFADRLVQGNARGTLIIARGGTGKSKLAWSMEAQLCGRLPVVKVDLQWDVKTERPGNPVLAAALESLHARSARPAEALQRALGDRPWVMLLDSLDEVPLDRRKVLVGHVNAAMKRFAGLRIVVFTRPPVFTGTYGLDHVEGLVELPQLSCARTAEVRDTLIKSPRERAAFDAFVKRYGLDRKAVGAAKRCYHPHLSTYRDFFVVKRLATSQQETALLASRAQVYGFYLTVLLVKDLQGVGVLPKDALATIDHIVAARDPGPGARNLRFSVADCEQHLTTGLKGAKRTAACERLMQSSLFRQDAQAGRFRLRNQTLADLFLARHAEALIAAKGCGVLKDRAALLESNEVAGFVAGLPQGQRCLSALTRELCRHGGFAQHNYEQLDQGLPGGATRLELLKKAQVEARAAGPNLCVGALLDRLSKGARGVETSAPKDAPAPAAPGS